VEVLYHEKLKKNAANDKIAFGSPGESGVTVYDWVVQ